MHQPKNLLFIDDDLAFLETIDRLFRARSDGSLHVFTAHSPGKAIAIMQKHAIDLAVVDIRMPVVDGLQFLYLLHRKHPNVRKAVLTGYAEPEYRAASLGSGAELFLEKPRTSEELEAVYDALHHLLHIQIEEGFRGVIRHLDLHELIQIECLSRRSCIIEVSSGIVTGRIFIQDGTVCHSEAGEYTGHDAFFYLLSLRSGSFQIQNFENPSRETISGSWEYLIMEASKIRDESAEIEPEPLQPPRIVVPAPEPAHPPTPPLATPPAAQTESFRIEPARPAEPVLVAETAPRVSFSAGAKSVEPPVPSLALEEIVACTLDGALTSQWQSPDPELRVGFLEFLTFKSRQLAQNLKLGAFQRLEIHASRGMLLAEIHEKSATFSRAASGGGDFNQMAELVRQQLDGPASGTQA